MLGNPGTVGDQRHRRDPACTKGHSRPIGGVWRPIENQQQVRSQQVPVRTDRSSQVWGAQLLFSIDDDLEVVVGRRAQLVEQLDRHQELGHWALGVRCGTREHTPVRIVAFLDRRPVNRVPVAVTVPRFQHRQIRIRLRPGASVDRLPVRLQVYEHGLARVFTQPRRVQGGAAVRRNTPGLEAALAEGDFHPDYELLDIVRMVGVVGQAEKVAIQGNSGVDVIIDDAADFIRGKRLALCRAGHRQHGDTYCHSGQFIQWFHPTKKGCLLRGSL